jgi:adenylylsulfate kinase
MNAVAVDEVSEAAIARGGMTIWLTGLPSAGKSTIARLVEDALRQAGQPVEVLDGDVVRTYLSRGLGFSREDRDENIRRIGFVASLLARNGVTVLVAAISPYRGARDEVRALHGEGHFQEVYVATPVSVCAERDVKGLYAGQRAGKVKGLTGVDDPYEAPLSPELIIEAHRETAQQSAYRVLELIASLSDGAAISSRTPARLGIGSAE